MIKQQTSQCETVERRKELWRGEKKEYITEKMSYCKTIIVLYNNNLKISANSLLKNNCDLQLGAEMSRVCPYQDVLLVLVDLTCSTDDSSVTDLVDLTTIQDSIPINPSTTSDLLVS